MENQELYEDKTVKEFVEKLRLGQSFLQEPNKEPDYVKNFVTKNVYTDINMIIVGQAMKDKNKLSNIVITQNDIHQRNLLIEPKAKAVATAMFKNYNAFYNKDDEAVKNNTAKIGEQKKDREGNPVKPIIYSNVFAAEDVLLTKFKAARDSNNNVQYYDQDVYSESNGVVDTYKKDYSYTDKNGVEHTYKKGDPVILHAKGSIIGDFESTGDHLAANRQSHLPAYIESQDLAPLYKRKDNSGKEILIEKMTEAFRGKLQGNYDGLKITNSEIDAIEKDFLQHPRAFRGVLRVAQTRAEGDKEKIEKMDAAINNKYQSQSHENDNVKENTNKASKKR